MSTTLHMGRLRDSFRRELALALSSRESEFEFRLTGFWPVYLCGVGRILKVTQAGQVETPQSIEPRPKDEHLGEARGVEELAAGSLFQYQDPLPQ